ncbi:MAG TPA: sugar ABC transporter ATP-binding protein [Chloroflexi bacterium]|nr:sugar ABC transporter ATP-binding protein [Chloroflexota bacterium]HBY08604.1 sugar ABC transporter ATP-binding protein [Chloroflexota bacterium]
MSTKTLTATTDVITFRKQSPFKRAGSELLKYSALFFITFIFAFPLFWMVTSALKSDPQIYTLPPIWIPIPAHFYNFMDGWTRLDFTTMAINSVFRYTIPVVLGTVLSSTFVAYGFAKVKWPGRDAVFFICMLTMMLPWQVTMVPLFITFKNLGWINSYRPLVVPSFFGSAYFIFLLRQFFKSIPEELSDAARIDGASELGILIRIILPLARPALAVVALFTFIWSWNNYLGPLIYINQDHLFPLALGIQRLNRIATSMGTSGNAYPHLMAVSTIIALPIIIAFFLAQRTFIEGISLTGIKG